MGSLGALGNDENATQVAGMQEKLDVKLASRLFVTLRAVRAEVLNKALQQAPQRQQLARAMVPQLAHIARGRHSHQSVAWRAKSLMRFHLFSHLLLKGVGGFAAPAGR